MLSQYSEADRKRALQSVESVEETIDQLISWNCHIKSPDDYYNSQTGMQLLAANCTLITAIGEGVNRINRVLPGFLTLNFPKTPWHAVVSMRNHIAHGYFELDADIVLETIKSDMSSLLEIFHKANILLSANEGL